MSSAGDPEGRRYSPRQRVPDAVNWRDGDAAVVDLDVTKTLAGTRLVIVGGTGFLGKVLLSLLLTEFPDVKHIFLMVRTRKSLTPFDRFKSEIWPTPVFDTVRGDDDMDESRAAVLKRLTPIAGDVTLPRAGVDDDSLKLLLADGGIDAVLNVSGVVSFTPPIDEGFRVNANGVTNLIQLCRDLASLDDGDASEKAVPLLHTSTCFVAGGRTGRIFEDAPDVFPFPRVADLDRSHWVPEREVEEGLALAKHIRARAEDAQLLSQVEETCRKKLRSKGQPTTGQAFDEAVKREKRRTLDRMLVDAGTERAAHWGWPNTYTYTKSVGEQLLQRSGVPYTIVRPAVVESSLAFPFPGWNEGINTSAPLIYMSLHGQVNYPTVDGHVLDVIPVDQVCFGTVLAAAALLRGEQDAVYQLGTSDSNALTVNRLIELTGLYKRRYMRNRNRGNPLLNRLYARIEPVAVTPATYKARSSPAIAKAIGGAANALKSLRGTPAAPVAKTLEKKLTSAKRGVDGAAMVMDAFLPFTSELDYRFRGDNARALMARVVEADRSKLPYAPEAFEWREYWLDVHIKGLRKWVFPHLDARLMKRPRADERYSDLLSFLDEVGEREGSHVALQRLLHSSTGKGGDAARGDAGGGDAGAGDVVPTLGTVTYRELLRRAKSTASRLADVGVHPGDRVGLIGKNSPEWAIAFFGILFAGGTVVTLDPTLDRHALGERLARVDVEFVLLDAAIDAVDDAACLDLEEFTAAPPVGVSATAPEVLVSPDDVAAIVFTSGTTGTPKPVTLTHKNITTVLASVAPLFKLSRRDTSLSVMPLHSSFELTCGLLLPLLRGATVTYVDEVTADSLSEAFRVAGISAMVGVPQVWEELEAEIHDELARSGPFAEAAYRAGMVINKTLGKTLGLNLGRLLFRPIHDRLGGKVRFMVSSGGHLPKKTAETFAALGIETKEAYGLTEGAPLLTLGDSKGTKPVPGIEVEVRNVDEDGVGEIVTRGDNVMLGYLDDEEATERALGKDGWLRTGDLGRIDKKGRITVVARDNEVITRKDGRKVYPREVEEILSGAPGVIEAAVVGVPDGRGGEQVEALIVIERPRRPSKASDIAFERMCASAIEVARLGAQRAARKLDAAFRPDTVLPTFDALPRTSERKLKRLEVIARLVASQAQLAAKKNDPAPEVLSATHDADVALSTPRVRQRLSAPGGRSGRERRDGDAPISLPQPVRDVAMRALGSVQKGFYDRFMQVVVEGEAHLPHNRPTIIAANHASHLDMGLIKHALGSYGQNLVTLAAKDYFFDGKWRSVYFENLTNLRPLDRSDNPREAMREASSLLEQGKTVLLFPEGTRTTSGELASFRPAITYLALKHGVDILPVFVGGTYRSMPRGSFLPRNRNVFVRIGTPISVDLLKSRTDAAGLRLSQACAKTADVVQLAVEALRDEKSFNVEAVVDETLGLKEKSEDAASENPLNDLFGYLEKRFQKDTASEKVTYYFSLGAGPETKWTVAIDKETCSIVNEKVGPADCVMKTDIPMFTKIVKEKYVPEIGDFMDGSIKTNDPELLINFLQVFNL